MHMLLSNFLMQHAASAAASAPDTAQVITPLLQLGVAGVFLIVLLWLVRVLLLREQKRADAEHTENIRLNSLIQKNQELIIPAMLAATQAVAASQAFLTTLQRELDVQEAARLLVLRTTGDKNDKH